MGLNCKYRLAPLLLISEISAALTCHWGALTLCQEPGSCGGVLSEGKWPLRIQQFRPSQMVKYYVCRQKSLSLNKHNGYGVPCVGLAIFTRPGKRLSLGFGSASYFFCVAMFCVCVT